MYPYEANMFQLLTFDLSSSANELNELSRFPLELSASLGDKESTKGSLGYIHEPKGGTAFTSSTHTATL